MHSKICSNCGNHYVHEYCNKCGQKTSHRITLQHIGHELVHVFTHAEKGLPLLFLKLFFHPGRVAYEYIVEGKRKKYFNPFQYLLLIASLAAFIAVNSHIYDKLAAAQLSNTSVNFGNSNLPEGIAHGLLHYYNLVVLMNLPFFSAATMLLFKKYHYNFAEHLTLNAFIVAQNTFYSSVFIIIIALWGNISMPFILFMVAISSAYYIMAYMQFFKQISFKGFLRSFLTLFLGYFFLQLFILLLIGAGHLLYANFNK